MRIIVQLVLVFSLVFFSCVAHAACTISTTPLNFGSYDVFSAVPLDSTGSISYSCTAEIIPPGFLVSIGPSPNSGSVDPRKMKLVGGSDYLIYNIYSNNKRTSVWGEGPQAFTVKAKKKSLTVYGRIPPLQNVIAGTYSETLTVTITW